MAKILIVDTSIMCVWLKVPGKEVTGKSNEYTYDIVAQHIEEERQKGTKLILPIATIIETGNHIAHCGNGYERRKSAEKFVECIENTINNNVAHINFALIFINFIFCKTITQIISDNA